MNQQHSTILNKLYISAMVLLAVPAILVPAGVGIAILHDYYIYQEMDTELTSEANEVLAGRGRPGFAEHFEKRLTEVKDRLWIMSSSQVDVRSPKHKSLWIPWSFSLLATLPLLGLYLIRKWLRWLRKNN